jgi:ornithine cyclodeaminase/alanine dehydrogenase-like protein (mu-crystallin family)
MRPESTLLLLGRQEIEALLDLPSVVATQRAAFTELESGTAQLGARTLLPNEEDDSVVFSYAARLNLAEPAVCKFGSVVPDNEQRGLPTVSDSVCRTRRSPASCCRAPRWPKRGAMSISRSRIRQAGSSGGSR